MRSSARLFVFALLLLPAFALVAWVAYWPPARGAVPQSTTAASGERAWELIRRVFHESSSHQTGSQANVRVRERLMREMRTLGLEPLEQRGFSCSDWGVCADVVNVLARVEGERDGALLLMAHYDSVPAGPGIGDDASGTAAVLETARAILARGTPARDLIVLITDGEELGLLGAHLFVSEHPWARDVRWVVNSEARGTTGPLLMFETSIDNRALVRTVARGNRGLVTNSLLYTVYRKLPNDTDLTVLRETGAQAVNFAMIGGAHRYHTRTDDLEHLDRRSLDHATAMVDAAASRILREAPERSGGDAVFFDVFGLFVVQWPAIWSLPLAAATAVVFVVIVSVTLRRRGLVRQFFSVWVRSGLSVAVAALALLGVSALLRFLGAMDAAWPAAPFWLLVAFGAALVLLLVFAQLLTKNADRFALWVAIWLPVVVLAPLVAWLVPGASFILWLPAAAATAGAISELRREIGVAPLAAILPYTASLFVMAALLWQLYLALGAPMLPLIAGLLFLTMLGTLPALPVGVAGREIRKVAVAALLLLGIATGMAARADQWSIDSPQPVAIQLVNVDGKASWALPQSSPPQMFRVADFGSAPVPLLPFEEARSHLVAAADPSDVPLPVVSVSSGETGGTIRLRVTPALEGTHHGVFLPAERVESVRLGERELREDARSSRAKIWSVRHGTTGAGGLDLTLKLRGSEPLELWVYERGYGLPASGAALVSARPEWAAPLRDPDRTIAVRTVRVDPIEAPPAAADSNGM